MNSFPKNDSRKGFTLVEILLVLGLLGVILTMIASVSSNAIDLNKTTKARFAAQRNAAAFSRQFDADLSQRVKRREARVVFEKKEGSDGVTLLTARLGNPVRSAVADRRVSLVAYRVENNRLERASVGYAYGEAGEAPDETAGTLSLKQLLGGGLSKPDEKAFQVIAPGVIRLEFSFLVRDGANRVVRSDAPPSQDSIEAVFATVVTLDPDLARMLSDSQLASVAAEFDDSAGGELPSKKWHEKALRLTSDLPEFPEPALQQVRVYQSAITFPKLQSTL